MNSEKVAIAAIAAIAYIESVALWLGYDGVLLTSVVGIISGLGGFMLQKSRRVEK